MGRSQTKRTWWAKVFGLAMVVLLFGLLAAGPAHAKTFTVNGTTDEADWSLSDGVCDVDAELESGAPLCTLRAAIQQANATPEADAINFNIPGSGVKTISPGSELPEITGTVTINGYSQPGASLNRLPKGNNAALLIELNGEDLDFGRALHIKASNSVVKGLAVHNFYPENIVIWGKNNKIEGNFVGIDTSGARDSDRSDCNGVTITQENDGTIGGNTIGGTSPAARNVISDNSCRGVWLNFFTRGNKVLGNFIGTTKDGTGTLGNGSGVSILSGASDNFVGDTAPGAGNIIAFGTDMVSPVYAVGVEVFDNGLGATRNRILSNSIHSNGGLGIDLAPCTGGGSCTFGRTSNDPGDADTGPNNLQNFPVLSSAKTKKGTTTIKGKLNSTPNKTFTIQFFSDLSGQDEGKKFIGSKSVATDSNGNASFTFVPTRAVPAGQNVTATATHPGGSTSEFSVPEAVARS
jgi:CSLREA domain-containing protein